MSLNPWEKLRAKDGQSLVEYSLIISLLAVTVFAALSLFGISVLDYFTRIVAVMPV